MTPIVLALVSMMLSLCVAMYYAFPKAGAVLDNKRTAIIVTALVFAIADIVALKWASIVYESTQPKNNQRINQPQQPTPNYHETNTVIPHLHRRH